MHSDAVLMFNHSICMKQNVETRLQECRQDHYKLLNQQELE